MILEDPVQLRIFGGSCITGKEEGCVLRTAEEE